jgi:hypothetical protein
MGKSSKQAQEDDYIMATRDAAEETWPASACPLAQIIPLREAPLEYLAFFVSLGCFEIDN